MHLVRREPWATIDLDVIRGHVFVRQDWRYIWAPPALGMPPWSEDEKAAYHHAVDRLIWGHWSMRAGIVVRRREIRSPNVVAKDLLQRFSHHHLTMTFDVRRVTTGEHWEATVNKADRRPRLDERGEPRNPPLPRADTDFVNRKLVLYDIDIEPHRASREENDGTRAPRAQPNFYVTPHEFGHALGYGNAHGKGEESKRGHRYFEDVRSIMNIGRRLRARHLFLITKTLGSMVPACTFAARVDA